MKLIMYYLLLLQILVSIILFVCFILVLGYLIFNMLYLLDLMITIQNSNIITNYSTINNTISDHYTIKANINFHKMYTDKITIKYRPLSHKIKIYSNIFSQILIKSKT